MIRFQITRTLQSAGGLLRLDVDITFRDRTFTVLIGESGAGKTSILRMLAGLMRPEKGRITHHDQVWFDPEKKINVRPQLRKVGFVFQDQALFPNMTVKKNIEFGQPETGNKERIQEIIDLFELGDLQYQYPANLSGGQKQKVALARAIINQPDILLLDEPLSAIDQRSKTMLQDYIHRIHLEFNLTTIMVSHDLSEIHKIADQVLELKKGRIIDQTERYRVLPLVMDGTIDRIETKDNSIIMEISITREFQAQQAVPLKKDDQVQIIKK